MRSTRRDRLSWWRTALGIAVLGAIVRVGVDKFGADAAYGR